MGLMRSAVLALGMLAASCQPAPADVGDGGTTSPEQLRVLLFSKTTGYRHASIPDAVAALTELGVERGWLVTATEDASLFDATTLGELDVVVWLLTSGEVLDADERAAFESFIRSGGGYVGVHSASDTEFDWPWYGQLLGAYVSSHPAIQPAELVVERGSHLSTAHLDPRWARTDEWYAFRTNPRADVTVLLSIDETSYDPDGTEMGDHPIAWYRGFDGGRAFYSALGHTSESYREPAFLDHLAGAIAWAAGGERDRVLLAELDGTGDGGDWQPQQSPPFPYGVGPDALLVTDVSGANQHLVRRGISVAPGRPYAMEALFTIVGPLDASPNSFCFNLNLADGDAVSTWAMNLDVLAPGDGVMKHMGFVDGAFAEIGQTQVAWAEPDTEYLLRVAVHADASDAPAPGMLSVRVMREGALLEAFSVDYQSFPYQPASAPLRIGANSHGSTFRMRSLRAYYLD
jgi:type 1 glutamine amidotransferase